MNSFPLSFVAWRIFTNAVTRRSGKGCARVEFEKRANYLKRIRLKECSAPATVSGARAEKQRAGNHRQREGACVYRRGWKGEEREG